MSKYNLENYLVMDAETGLFDYLNNEGIIEKLKSLEFKSKIEVGQRELDEIALDVYGSEELWWVIAIYNDIINPSMFSNSVLYIPGRIDLEKIFLKHTEG